ncbi:hypothetical protein VTN77DRAFT_471 [Rasamsonia byssochlamydoides]|uniref:uncharacterized protein n=1 Tax=Rasamsonia byssochlamydoides TaxID=89139 RepID=UPI003743E014
MNVVPPDPEPASSSGVHAQESSASQGPREHIDVDDDPGLGDGDSAVGDDAPLSTASLSSSIFNYQYENGRRYHAYRQGEYVIPNDEREQERMNLHHHIHQLVLGGALFRAPISPHPQRILDLGTGTGLWAIDMADEYPQATVIGTDLSPIQPSWVPPNCQFELDDFESEWNFSKPFDFIHGRSLAGSIRDHDRFLRQCLDNLTPGGWLELADFAVAVYADDDTLQRATNLLEWQDRLEEASTKFGKRLNVAHQYKDWMSRAGFVNVKEDVYKVPLSPWPKDPKLKELARYEQASMLEALDAYTLALFSRVLGWSTARIHVLLAGVRQEILDRTIHLYAKLYYVYGQKREAGVTTA